MEDDVACSRNSQQQDPSYAYYTSSPTLIVEQVNTFDIKVFF